MLSQSRGTGTSLHSDGWEMAASTRRKKQLSCSHLLSMCSRADRVRMVKDRAHVQNGSVLQNQLVFPTIVPVVEGVPSPHSRHSHSVYKVSPAVRENLVMRGILDNIQLPSRLRECLMPGPRVGAYHLNSVYCPVQCYLLIWVQRSSEMDNPKYKRCPKHKWLTLKKMPFL